MNDYFILFAFVSASDLENAKKFAEEPSNGFLYEISFSNYQDKDLFEKKRPKCIERVSAFPNENEYVFPCFSCF